MPADGANLVLVMPDETVESIAARVRQSGAARVQLLVPDGTAALQSGSGFARLRGSLGGQIELQVISSDERTLSAARASQYEAIGVEGARVGPPALPTDGRTVVLPPLPAAPAPLSPEDAEFLAALERLPQHDPYSDLAREDPELFNGLDDLADLLNDPQPAPGQRRPAAGRSPTPRRTPETTAGARERRPTSGRLPVAGRPVQRDDLDPDWDEEPAEAEPPRRRGGRQASSDDPLAERPVRRGDLRSTTPARGRTGSRRTGRALALADQPERAPARPLRWVMPLLVALVLFGLVFVWYLSARATVQVLLATPVPVTFTNIVLPLSGATSEPSDSTAVQAVPVQGRVQLAVQGRGSQVLTPAGLARGQVTLVNRLPQPIDLPANTEFVAKNPQGQPASFLIDQPQQVPAAVTTRTATGESTAYGQLSVAVTARSPGVASNVEADSMLWMVLNGQRVENSGNLVMSNTALTGGTDENVLVVTQDDVNRALTGIDTQLDAAALQQLAAPSDRPGYVLDTQTLHRADMQTVAISPTLGTQLDPQNPVFEVRVAARYDALATPSRRPLDNQLQTAVRNYFAQGVTKLCPAGRVPVDITVNGRRWAESRLEVDGEGACMPDPSNVRAQVLSAVRGQDHGAAEQQLRALQQQGLIGDFALPPRDTLPSYEFLLDVLLTTPSTPTPSPSAAVPPTAAPAADATPPAADPTPQVGP